MPEIGVAAFPASLVRVTPSDIASMTEPLPDQAATGGPRLVLLRHAKSDWSDPSQADIDRPLAPRGERAAVLMGRYLRQLRLIPDLVLCSPARRTRDTWALAGGQLDRRGVPLIDDRLYAGGVPGYLQALADHGPDHRLIVMVGHNPDLADLAQQLARQHDTADRRQAEAKFPTAGLAVFDLDPGSLSPDRAGGPMIHFAVPKGLV